MAAAVAVETHDLQKHYKNETVITYPDLTFAGGKSYLILGSSGCGKSTLLNMIAGVLSPDGGSIMLDGRDTAGMTQKEKDLFRIRNVGYIYQDFKLIDEMTVIDNINVLKLERVDTSAAGAWLERLGIADKANKKIKHLSGGQKQRVAIARALVKSPSLILADEPTGNLNAAIGESVVRDLLDAAKGATLIVVSHEEKFIPYFDEVIRLGGQNNA